MANTTRITLSEEYALDIDRYNFVIIKFVTITGEQKVGKKTKPENIGKVREVPVGYFSNLESAVNAIVHRELCDIKSDNMEDIFKMLKSMERMMGSAAKFDKKYMEG